MKDDEQIIQNFIKYWLLFYGDVNDKKGINDASLKNLEEAFINLKYIISKNNSVPIEVAGIFIDMYSSVESLAQIPR